jgi:cohesin complex subunit SA-1/2
MQDDESATESQSTLSRSRRQSLDQDESDEDDETSNHANGNDSDPEFTTSSRRTSPRTSRRRPSQNDALTIRVPKESTPSPAKKNSNRSRGPSVRNALNPKMKPVQSALQSLSKKVLMAEEIKDPSQSLVASLLLGLVSSSSRRQEKNGKNGTHDRRVVDVEDFLSKQMSCYTEDLFAIARNVVSLYNSDPNRAQVRLVNLLFRSVGGTKNSELEEDKVQLEDMGNDEWGDVVTDLVDDMRYTPETCVLFCSDPDGAVHYSAVLNSVKGDLEKGDEIDKGKKASVTSLKDIPVTASSLGVREYRKIYQEFWYVLGHVALVEGGMSGSASVVPFTEDEIDDSSASQVDNDRDAKHGKTAKSPKDGSSGGGIATRFDTEVVRDILSRLVELVSVGQPDIRAAASTAVYSMGQAILDKTVRLSEKLQIVTRQFAAAAGGKGKKNSSAKAESLRFQIDSLRRTRDTLDEIVEALVIKGVFIHRYRDSNMFNRASSIHALADMVVRRPDVFLKDKYLKYFGWMLSDKAECVRMAALEGLTRPFEEVENARKNGQETSIDLSHLEHVSVKFLKRISETVIDVHSSVQERGVKLMLSLLRAGFLDNIDDEQMWNQVNILAFETDGTPAVRRDALYFIMEQLEEFDDGDDEGNDKGKKRKSLDNSQPSDKKAAQRLDAIASWAAHTLTDGDVPLENIQIHLVNHLVNSLRDMPDHKDIVTNWNAMIRAITDEKIATTSQGNAAGAKADLAKQRVLVEILVCAARLEVEAVADSNFLVSDLDPVVTRVSERKKTSKRNTVTNSLNHELLSVALIKSLPNLLDKFKSDSKILESLTLLPRYFGECYLCQQKQYLRVFVHVYLISLQFHQCLLFPNEKTILYPS